MRPVNITLDGKQIIAPAGASLLDVARENGVDIPTLCHDPRLVPFGACRLCLVEVEGARRPVPACTTTINEGMVVRTDTEEIAGLRRMALELLLSAHYGDCEGPCKRACPAGIDIQGFIALIACGEYKEALKLIKEQMPLPAVCGRVCPAFCEQECRRNLVDEPLAICDLKRFVADIDLKQNGQAFRPQVKPPTGKKVAIVGGGPAGLSAAYWLAQEGHAVTIFEANPFLGGMLLYGIPAYRLPKDVLAREIALITELCEDVKLNTAMGRDFTVAELKAKGFDAVLVTIGAQASQSMRVPGEDLEGVYGGVDFLHAVASGDAPALSGHVAVVGGGNTAMDAARTSLRLGAREVSILYRRSRTELPARLEEIEEAEEEGVKFNFMTAPTRLIGKDGKLTAVECRKMALGEPDASGRRSPQPIAGSEYEIPVDAVIMAIGQTLERSAFAGSHELEPAKGYIKANAATMSTDIPGVFTAGDCQTGPATVVEAVGAAHRAAIAIHNFLTTGEAKVPDLPFNCSKGELDEIDPAELADRERLPRVHKKIGAAAGRKTNFKEYTSGFTPEMAAKEAARCLSCGCQDAFTCVLREHATRFGVSQERFGKGSKRHPIKDDHRFILQDSNKCVLCGSCVRICSEVEGIDALGFAFRGYDTVVQPSLQLPLAETLCNSCGQCVSACPTGALSARIKLPKPGPWKTQTVASVCSYCGVGCQLELNVVGNKLVNVTSPIGNPVNEGNLCSRGSFRYHWVNDENRLKLPVLRKDNQTTEISWKEGIQAAARLLGDIKSYLGSERLAVLVSPRLTVEENYLAQKFARLALGTNHVGPLTGEVPQFFSSANYSDLDLADLVLVVGTDLPANYSVVGHRVRRAAERGAAVIGINTHSTRLDTLAKMTVEINGRKILALLQAMIKYVLDYDLTDDFAKHQFADQIEAMAKELGPFSLDKIEEITRVKPAKLVDMINLYLRAKNPVIVTNAELGGSELASLANLALLAGNVGRPASGLLILQPYANSCGQRLAGVGVNNLPGGRPVTDAKARLKLGAAWGTELPVPSNQGWPAAVDGLVIISGGEAIELEALFPKRPLTVVITPREIAGLAKANLTLPGASFAETSGTYLNSEGRWQKLQAALLPPGGKQNWQIICELLEAMGYPQNYTCPDDILAEVRSFTEEDIPLPIQKK